MGQKGENSKNSEDDKDGNNLRKMKRFFVLYFGIELLLVGVVILVSSYNSLFTGISIGRIGLVLKLIIFEIL